MKLATVALIDKRPPSDLLVVPLFQRENKLIWPKVFEKEKQTYEGPIKVGDFKGKEGDIALQYPLKGIEPRLIFVGLGDADKLTVERLRRAITPAVKHALKFKAKSLTLIVPEIPSLSEEDVLRGLCEGLFLSNYLFDKLKVDSIKLEPPVRLEKINLITSSKKALQIAEKALLISEGVYLARDLVNGNADDITPQTLAKFALGLAKEYSKIETTIFDKKRLEKEGFGLLLAVNRGSSREPVLIVAKYQGNPKSKDNTVLIGKGVTYDTGGLNLKMTGSMETMKCDMGGAATVLATLQVAARLQLKQNITVVVPATENGIDAASYKPGDVYKSYSGKSVEIGNTDAEGRLILADAISYAVRNLKPTRIIDVATLTGAMEIALGNETTGLFSNHDALADSITRAGSETFERVWRFPLFEEYRDQLRSDIADIKNHGGRPAGAITASLFLQDFVESTPWAHLDVAGTAFINDSRRYHPRYGTGIGVRLLTQFFENL